MVKRALVVVFLALMLALMKPVPASAHPGVLFALALPFISAELAGPIYGPPVYSAPVYAAPPYAPPVYAAPPVYVPAPAYGPRVVYAPRRVFVPAYRGFAPRGFYGPRVVGRRWGRW